MSTLRCSYGKSKGRCSMRVLYLGPGIFFCKFWRNLALVKCPSACRLCRLAQSAGRGLGMRHFTRKFLHKGLVALVKCPSAFRSIVGPGMFISTVHARTKCSPRSWFAAFALQILAQSGSSAASTCISTAQARTKCGLRSWSAAFHL